ncbi:hypothetical protein GGR42_002143 [Saonia flava]|uniref:Uncharacterized protein n=1 Tax=Saonia flava TaxID=523696 RepID=A0A846QTZ0_9FLAO|nr:DUF6503 family protein [Saonia flava]NJB71681.1 hypothetical protein [Saonia flava]
MKTLYIVLFCFLFCPLLSVGQELTGPKLLNRAIEYHDPNGTWKTFKGKLSITMKTPDKSNRISDIILDLPEKYFSLTVKKDGDITEQTLHKEKCELALNGNTSLSPKDIKNHRLTCDRTKMMKDYYTYLYGLPMKLRDPGTHVAPKVYPKHFRGKDYLAIKVTYDESVGKDTWYFYFDPETYAMEIYQFFHDERKNDGEFIILNGIEEVQGIKMPKTRAWYFNKDDKYLGTDILTKTSSL